jgi:hypothetical protein
MSSARLNKQALNGPAMGGLQSRGIKEAEPDAAAAGDLARGRGASDDRLAVTRSAVPESTMK